MDTWQTLAKAFETSVSGPTPSQLERARQLGVAEVTPTTPRTLAAYFLRRAIGEDAGFSDGPVRGSAQARIDYLRTVTLEAGLPFKPPSSEGHLMAMLLVAWAHLNAKQLKELQPEPGDIVKRAGNWFEVSSMGSDGRIHFKGTGQRDYPMRLEEIVKPAHTQYTEFKRMAANVRAEASVESQLGAADLARLGQWAVEVSPEIDTTEHLRAEINSAPDEKPLQRFLESHPEFLTHLLLNHHAKWVIPQVQLGGEYRPDFLVGGLSSLGVEWCAVELESPTAQLFIQSGELGVKARHGVYQIEQWREWLRENLDYARKVQNGAGLSGIRSDLPGLVLVGRSRDSIDDFPTRTVEGTGRNIAIRSYDWLLRSLDVRMPGLGSVEIPEWRDMASRHRSASSLLDEVF